jgi:hypothetical protein
MSVAARCGPKKLAHPALSATAVAQTQTPFVVSSPSGRLLTVKFLLILAVACAQALPVFAGDKEKPNSPLVIPVTGTGQSTTTKLGNSFVTRTRSGQSFTTTQLGSSTITRDSKGNTWTTTKLGNSYVTRGPDGQRQTTSQLGNSFVTRDSKTGSTFTTSPLGNSLQTRGSGGSSYSTTPLGNSFITRGTSSKKDDSKSTRVIVVPAQK